MTKEEKESTWNKTRELLLFQLKLFADAARDILLSPVAIVCFIMDLGEKDPKKESNFEKLMAFGRRTDHHINLFKHRRSYKKGLMTVDDAAKLVEDTLKNEIQTGEYSDKAINAVKDAFKNRFDNNPNKESDSDSSAKK